MYNYIKKNQKRLMAIFAVFLMIAFVATMGPNTCRQMNYGEYVVGHIGDQKVTQQDVHDAETQWHIISQQVVVRAPKELQDQGAPQWLPLATRLLPQRAIEQIRENTEMYYLLLAEAKRMGVPPNPAQVDDIFAKDPNLGVMTDKGVVPLDRLPRSARDSVRFSVANLLTIVSAFGRAADVVKVSQPLAQHFVAEQLQMIKVQLVEFSAKDFEGNVPTPTQQQLQEQFEKYADALPDSPPTEKNPFGFGYRYPNRVKLQYIGVPRELVRKAVQATRSDYDWEVEAQRYYQKHLTEFPASAPSTEPATRETFTLGNAGATPTKHPTTKPFEEVRSEIMQRLLEPQIDRLARQMQGDIASRLNSGYEAYRAAHPGAGSATAPAPAPTTATAAATGPAAPYESFAFLQNLAQEMERKYHVLPTIASVTDSFKTEKDLAQLPGIGQVPSFAQYAVVAGEAFVPPAQKDSPNVLPLLKPSKPIHDDAGDVFIFRLTAMDPAHKPASLAEVDRQVEQDWRLAQAFEQARAQAAKLAEAARSNGLAAAAGDRKLITTGFFQRSANTPIENFSLSPRAQVVFLRDAFKLVSDASKNNVKHPVGLIPLAPDGKVVVAELVEAESGVRPDAIDIARSLFADRIHQEYTQALAMDWFNYDSVVTRLDYKDESGRKRSPAAAIPAAQ